MLHPDQSCCLAHISTQLAALERGARWICCFSQSPVRSRPTRVFGVTLSLLREGASACWSATRPSGGLGGSTGDVLRNGSGSAISAGAHAGVDQQTLEARAYGVARLFDPFLVNSVVGFIGPEYLFDERQIIRAGLEDHFMGKLLAADGVDICYTNHAEADQNSADNLLMLLATAGVNYVMGVPCADDVMLNLSIDELPRRGSVRRLLGLRPARSFAAWLERLGLWRDGRLIEVPRERLPGGLARCCGCRACRSTGGLACGWVVGRFSIGLLYSRRGRLENRPHIKRSIGNRPHIKRHDANVPHANRIGR